MSEGGTDSSVGENEFYCGGTESSYEDDEPVLIDAGELPFAGYEAYTSVDGDSRDKPITADEFLNMI